MSTVTPVVRKWIEEGLADPEAFWARAAEALPWFRPWDRAFEWTFPTFRWFIGGETNLAYNALDRHVASGRGGHPALVYMNERGDRQTFSYAELLALVEDIAASLRALGIGKGDRLTIYMPTSPEAIALMLATVRIGAIHSVVFAGFGASRIGGPHQRQRLTARLRRGRHVSQGQGGRSQGRSSTMPSRRVEIRWSTSSCSSEAHDAHRSRPHAISGGRSSWRAAAAGRVSTS